MDHANQQRSETDPDSSADLKAASAAEKALPPSPSSSSAVPSPTPSPPSKASDVKTASPPSDFAPATTDAAVEEDKRELTKEEQVEEALNCPCIASMKEGPCGESFISAYRCFLESESEPKGMECMDQFQSMQTCIGEHPDDYNFDDDDETENDKDGQQIRESKPSTTSTAVTADEGPVSPSDSRSEAPSKLADAPKPTDAETQKEADVSTSKASSSSTA